ncbi:RNA polymerase sigma-B factor [Allocatelliglobosispora scoriae]|uniref:RNA polymerase sigma-B factor n=1 Tax=Allocatelliglobosispora scoriae TaxID=643052 RepID=A0A841BM04_9ACTN|nr:SigB/SigF/SigG family RNA polymerase sigma factor [Allocatelliglobosispora scoriae]MBB5868685.1 RNA polymerase sigma-B factor [Allocatelliglobosispora scoriae]
MTLLAQLGELPPGDTRRAAVRTRAIECYLPLATHFARQFDHRGEPLADLTQVAVLGLIKAVDRYDADRGVAFTTYAVPTILGEVKRHFRDTTWSVRLPRQLHDRWQQVAAARDHLAQLLQRPPTTAEIAGYLAIGTTAVIEAGDCAKAYRARSLTLPVAGSPNRVLGDLLGEPDSAIDAVDLRTTLRRRLAELPPREQRIIELRFSAELTQSQIAEVLGLSQMHVSRLLTRALAQLRERLRADGGPQLLDA